MKSTVRVGVALAFLVLTAGCERRDRVYEDPAGEVVDAAALAKAKGVRVVQTRCKARFAMPADATPLVTLTPTELLLGRESLLTLPSPASLAASGVEAKHKHGDPTSTRIVPLVDALAARRRADDGASLNPEHVARILIDRDTPSRALFEVVVSIGEAGFRSSVLAEAPSGLVVVDEPVLGTQCGSLAPSLGLVVRAEPDGGISLRWSGGTLGPGCEPGAGVTLPPIDGRPDWAGLTRCVAKTKAAHPGLADELRVSVVGDRLEPALGGLLREALSCTESGEALTRYIDT